MTTLMHTNYRTPRIRQTLESRLSAASSQEILQYADAAERLLPTLQPERCYAISELLPRITKVEPAASPMEEVIPGGDWLHDLTLFIEDATRAAHVTVEAAGEPILSTQEVAGKLNVSTKTISRWRKQGLAGRWFFVKGRMRLGFLASSVERFVAANSRLVQLGGQFSQISKHERQAILEQAREMSQAGCSPAEVVKCLTRFTGRSAETIRYTLKRHDRQDPSSAVFPDHYGPLRDETRQKIYQLFRRGHSVESLSRQFGRPKGAVEKIVAQMRGRRILELPLDFIPSDEFTGHLSDEAERAILAPMPASDQPSKRIRLPKGLPSYLASLYEIPLLTREQEVHLFRRMNYLKYKAARLRSKLDLARPSKRLMDRIEKLYEESVATKNQILQANLRLVVSVAKRYIAPSCTFFDLVSDGNLSLIRAVEKFDYSRGNKLSTYATWAITKNFARSIPQELRHHDRFRTASTELFIDAEDDRSDPQEQEVVQTQRESQVAQLLTRLDRREQEIIVSRFGLGHNRQPRTLQEVGRQLGVTKERIRQLEQRALARLRSAADEEHITFSV